MLPTFFYRLRGRQEALESIFDTRPPIEELKDELSSFMKKCQLKLRKHTEEFQDSNNKVTKLESEISLLK